MKNSIFVLFAAYISSLFGQTGDSSYQAYFDYMQKYPDSLGIKGSYENGEIELIFDEKEMDEAGKKVGRKVGVVADDRYWLWLNDAVRFPNGKTGVYGRLMWKTALEGPSGVAVVPVLGSGKIKLNLNYRHATRSWEYELPRGVINQGEDPEKAAMRELKEETGLIPSEVHFLGEMTPDTGMTRALVHLYLGKVSEEEEATPEESEAIAAVEAFTLEELKEGFRKGYMTTLISGKETQVPLRDPFLAMALFQAEIRNLIVN